ncbi:glycosyltransferase family 4 protein [Neoroseomonas oryzicola]|uniref:Glycosyltransferase family 4 protein n=1 Tax=Neoroseomonas oryzicola TaxID=535904 RepID=A0A9X9WBW0_9PROT|nr:glycosyltransferase family 1 protein [Neoroseomonas oryzicola]MBR0657820.1 glycosyltransferase family 4 protein [Neoroseomonas oryzicola]NKE18612.1 glycosyltransferase family 4 protein [Neoroseomonas oryzicola]
MTGIALNGRFLTQGMTGVQRFATEIVAAADVLAATGEWPAVRVLHPAGARDAGLRHLRAESVGSRGGQAWEQLDLPRALKGEVLVNLGNTAPLMAGGRQAVVIHDAGAFDTPESYSFAFRTWYRLLQTRLARRGAQILTVSEFSRGRIAAALGIDAASIGVLPEGGEHILRFPADGAVLAKHGLTPGRFALVVGNPAAHKNLAALTAAAATLGAHGLTLAVAGAADPAVFRAGGGIAAEAARVLGRVSDAELRTLYENALCLIFPSRYEGFGLPPLEAMVCGCPVIAARAGAVPEVCADAALWFDTARPASLQDAVGRLATDRGLQAHLRAAGIARGAGFTWDAAARRLLALVQERFR